MKLKDLNGTIYCYICKNAKYSEMMYFDIKEDAENYFYSKYNKLDHQLPTKWTKVKLTERVYKDNKVISEKILKEAKY